MPININLDTNYSAAQKTDMETALSDALALHDLVINPPLNLTDKERSSSPSIDEQRELYVNDAISNLAALHPNLLGPEITAARAATLWELRNTSMQFKARLEALMDRVTDDIINAEYLCLKFTQDMRENASRFKDRNVPGADVVWDRLKGLHTRSSNPEPVTP